MAKQGAKKRKEENSRHMSNLLRLIIGCNVVYILVRMIFFYSSFTWKHWIGLILISLAYAIPYKQLASMAEPAYTDDGELIDGGFDMSTEGVCGYQDSQRIKLLASSKASCQMILRERRRMKRLVRKGKSWKEKLQDPNFLRHEPDRSSR